MFVYSIILRLYRKYDLEEINHCFIILKSFANSHLINIVQKKSHIRRQKGIGKKK